MSTKPESSNEQSAGSVGLSTRRRAVSPTESMGIRLSERAGAQVKAIMQKQNCPDTMYLYVGVKGGGCSGLQYVLDLRDEVYVPVTEQDQVFESQGILVVCDLKSYVVGNLSGTLVDYQDGLLGAGFTFDNPNAKQSCGCGASYSP